MQSSSKRLHHAVSMIDFAVQTLWVNLSTFLNSLLINTFVYNAEHISVLNHAHFISFCNDISQRETMYKYLIKAQHSQDQREANQWNGFDQRNAMGLDCPIMLSYQSTFTFFMHNFFQYNGFFIFTNCIIAFAKRAVNEPKRAA